MLRIFRGFLLRLHKKKLSYLFFVAVVLFLVYLLSNFGEHLDFDLLPVKHHRTEDTIFMTALTSAVSPHNPRDSDNNPRDKDHGSSKMKSRRRSSLIEENQNDFLAEVEMNSKPKSIETEMNLKHLTFSELSNSRQKAVVDSFLHAWNAYKKYAWGQDELRPISKTGQEWMGVGLSIIDSLDTLIIMGLNEEYNLSRDWVEKNLNFDRDVEVQLFEMTIRTLGGLLAAFHLSNDQLFLNKAIELGNKLTPCFKGATKVPCIRINLPRQQATFLEISAAEIGSIQLEFRDLSRSSNDSKFENEVSAVSDHLHHMKKLDGLVPCFLSPHTGLFLTSSPISVGASADSYYEYLLKQWIQTGKTREWMKKDYLNSIEGIKKHLLRFSQPNRFAFVGSLTNTASNTPLRNEMEHLSCFLPGTLALGVIHGLDKSHLQLASDLTNTCYHMYNSTPTKLSPEVAVMNTDVNRNVDITTQYNTRYNAQRPETVESLFYMYRASNNPIYREWGWNIFKAFEKHMKVDGGYASIDNVMSVENPGHKDKMESFFLAETLKYLFLLFSDDQNKLSLDKYVMNTEAHPLPIYAS